MTGLAHALRYMSVARLGANKKCRRPHGVFSTSKKSVILKILFYENFHCCCSAIGMSAADDVNTVLELTLLLTAEVEYLGADDIAVVGVDAVDACGHIEGEVVDLQLVGIFRFAVGFMVVEPYDVAAGSER